MAKRLLLTLLALLGLAAQVAPAQAAACGRAASALVIAAQEEGAAVAGVRYGGRGAIPAAGTICADPPAPMAVAPRHAPVLIGIDRAHE
ncbi:MAG TPA: hypothetical protein VFP68_18090 [Burkholderiaceae bacterium]|nr:hypothetical protein [Novosphingobium sp.]HET9645216.1 hypothetical protein [Burkholderiaceae bacterium]